MISDGHGRLFTNLAQAEPAVRLLSWCHCLGSGSRSFSMRGPRKAEQRRQERDRGDDRHETTIADV